MKLLSIVSMMFAIQSWQFLSPTFAMDGTGPSGSRQSTEQAAWAEIEESLRAMQLGDTQVQEINKLIENTPTYKAFLIEGNKKAKDRPCTTLLHESAERGHLEIARLLLDQGADIQAQNTSGLTPLNYTRRLLDNMSEVYMQRERGIFRKIIHMLESLTAFEQRDAVTLMAHLHEGKFIDLDLMKARLGRTEYQEAEFSSFLNALSAQAPLRTALDIQTVRVIVDAQEQELSVEEAKEKVIELVRSWRSAANQSTGTFF